MRIKFNRTLKTITQCTRRYSIAACHFFLQLFSQRLSDRIESLLKRMFSDFRGTNMRCACYLKKYSSAQKRKPSPWTFSFSFTSVSFRTKTRFIHFLAARVTLAQHGDVQLWKVNGEWKSTCYVDGPSLPAMACSYLESDLGREFYLLNWYECEFCESFLSSVRGNNCVIHHVYHRKWTRGNSAGPAKYFCSGATIILIEWILFVQKRTRTCTCWSLVRIRMFLWDS